MIRLRPSFLICSERSGSNLIRSLLNAHPEIYAPEPIHLGAFWARVEEFGDLHDDERWGWLLRAIVEFLDSWKGTLDPSLDFTVEGLMAAIPTRDFISIYEHIYGLGLATSGKEHLFIKENHTAQRAGLFLRHYPDAKFIYQVRDPRDFLASCKKFRGYKYGSAVEALKVWCADQEAALDLMTRLPTGQVLSGSYEDLIHTPEPQLRRVCEFLGVPYAPEMLEFYKTEDARRSAAHEAWRNLGKPIITSNSGRYADSLSRIEIALVEELAGPLMERLGYARQHTKPSLLQRAGVSFYAGIERHLCRADDASGSAAVHRTIDRHVGASRRVS